MFKKCMFAVLTVLAMTGVLVTPISAELQKTHLKVAGMTSTQNMNKYILAPYFTKEIIERSNGSVTADYKTSDALGLKGTEILRLLKMGVFAAENKAPQYARVSHR